MKGSVTSIADKTLSFHRFMIFLFHWNVLHCYLKVCFLLFQHSKLTVLQAKMGFFMFQYKTSNNGLSSDHGILGFSLCYVKLHTSLPLHQLTLRNGGRVEQKIFCGSKQKIDSFTNINDKFSLFNISAAKLHAVEISACQIQAYIIKAGEFFSGELL